MKNILLVAIICMNSVVGLGQKSVQIPLSINTTTKPISFITNVRTSLLESKQKGALGIATSQSKLYYSFIKKSSKIIFEVPNASELLATGLGTKIASKSRVEWKFDNSKENQYKLYITTAGDSAKNFIVYSGYLYFPTLNKWKLIASFKISGSTEGLHATTLFKSSTISANLEDLFIDIWAQDDNGAWTKIQNAGIQKPVLLPFSDVDSAYRAIRDALTIQHAISNNQTDAINLKNGLYYTLMKKSTNPTVVKNTDTVTIYYKGYIMGTEIVFDQTSKDTRTFPLGRLIKGWQIGLEGTHVGDKVKLLIPSGLAYGIRTRSPMIPPNSILVFEIETVDAKPFIK